MSNSAYTQSITELFAKLYKPRSEVVPFNRSDLETICQKYNVKNDEGDVYVVSHNTSENKWRCNCMGFWRLKNKAEGCKHVKEIKGELGL